MTTGEQNAALLKAIAGVSEAWDVLREAKRKSDAAEGTMMTVAKQHPGFLFYNTRGRIIRDGKGAELKIDHANVWDHTTPHLAVWCHYRTTTGSWSKSPSRRVTIDLLSFKPEEEKQTT